MHEYKRLDPSTLQESEQGKMYRITRVGSHTVTQVWHDKEIALSYDKSTSRVSVSVLDHVGEVDQSFFGFVGVRVDGAEKDLQLTGGTTSFYLSGKSGSVVVVESINPSGFKGGRIEVEF